MGQDNSVIDDNTPPETLSERSLAAVADYIKSGGAGRIVVMTGAGISTAAGIPDFRSPETGLYANLSRLNLPYAEAVFDISYFRQHPEPFYVLAKELYPGKYHPTISHVFIALLADKGLLHHLFTQNIDCLERQAGVPDDLIVEAHGSFATQRCIECATEYPDDQMKEHVEGGDVPHCIAKGCNGLVKPDIVFFGEALPQVFRDRQHYPSTADLALVMGTSLSVQPFSSLPSLVRPQVPRVLFNLEQVGGLGSRADDVLSLGSCDSGIRKLADELGWRDELEAKWRRLVGEKEAERQLAAAERHAPVEQEDIDQLVDRVGEALHITGESTPNSEEAEAEAEVEAKPVEEAAEDGNKEELKEGKTPAVGDGNTPPAEPVTGDTGVKGVELSKSTGEVVKQETSPATGPGDVSKKGDTSSSEDPKVSKSAL